MSLTIIVEGGGSGTLNRRIDCRRAFHTLFAKVAPKGALPSVYAAGSRATALDHHGRVPGSIAVVDSEGPATEMGRAVYQMVQIMESWFLADAGTTARILKIDERRLSGNPKIEEAPKADVLQRLKSCGYDKRQHSFRILKEIDPAKVRKASTHADQLFRRVEQGV